MARPIVLGVVGDSGSGKTTLTRGLIRVLGVEHATRLNADDYHRYDHRQRAELGVTPLHPDSNHVDILTQHLRSAVLNRCTYLSRVLSRPRGGTVKEERT